MLNHVLSAWKEPFTIFGSPEWGGIIAQDELFARMVFNFSPPPARPSQLIPGTDEYRVNFWGYSTVAFFAPMARFSAAAAGGGGGQAVIDEFKTMVRECHKAGIEVILDVVFNHTAEGNERGPSISFRCCTKS